MENKITWKEAASMGLCLIVSKCFFSSITTLIKLTGTAAWITTIVSAVVCLIFLSAVVSLLRMFNGKDMSEIFEIVLGKFCGKLLTFVFFIYAVFYTGTSLREVIDIIKLYDYPLTPLNIITVCFLIVGGVSANAGAKNLAKVTSLLIIPIMASIVLIIPLCLKYYNFNNIFPISGYGFDEILKYGALRSSAYSDIVFLAMIAGIMGGSIAGKERTARLSSNVFKKAGVLSVAIGGAFISVTSLCYMAAFNYNIGKTNISAVAEMVRLIYFDRFYQRMELLFFFFIMLAGIMLLSIMYYVIIHLYGKIFEIPKRNLLIFPCGVLIFFAVKLPSGILPDNTGSGFNAYMLTIRQYSMVLMLMVPVAVWIIALFRKSARQLGKEAE